MSSYYREHVSYPNVTAGPYPPHLVTALENVGSNITNIHHAPSATAQDDPNARRCSVKGCSAPLPDNYPHKMCDGCRGRHRVYAMTKRAKRKMEKAALNGSAHTGQPVVWMPPDDATQQEREESAEPSEPVAGPSRQYEPSTQVSQVADENTPQFDFPQGWDSRAIDPRLFSHTSELAGALTLPTTPSQRSTDHGFFARNDHHPQRQSSEQRSSSRATSVAPPPPSAQPEIHPVLAEVLKAVPSFHLPTRVTSGPTVPVASAPSSDGQLPPRFCSIKGCKTLIAGNSFFKMCEPCRDRYRSYGTTKRAKWKREKEVAVAELHKLRSEEDARRAAQGLPPLPPEPDQWQEYSSNHTPDEEPGPSSSSGTLGTVDPGEPTPSSAPLPPRMCTVSHCREILPGDYQFLRCERHRIQNRHHSKLKRVRDKEVKAQVYDGWAAAAGVRATSQDPTNDSPTDVAVAPSDIALAFGSLDRFRESSLEPEFTGPVVEAGVTLSPQVDDTPQGEPSTGLPPAARGTRRTNHVCSTKACSNLLSPSNPWKMCDLCRSRDRAGRRLKALRDSGLIPPDVAEDKIEEVKHEVEGRERMKEEGSEKREKKSKKKAKKAEKPVVESHRAGVVRAGSSGSATVSDLPVQQQQQSSGDGTETTTTDASSNTSVAPSALHHTSPSGLPSHTSVFSSVPVPNHANLVFMEPLLGQIAELQRGFPQQQSTNADNSGIMNEPQLPETRRGSEAAVQSNMDIATADVSSPAPLAPVTKKRSKGKGKAKASPQAVQAIAQDHVQQQSQSDETSRPNPPQTVAPEATTSTPTAAPAASPSDPTPQAATAQAYPISGNGQPSYPYYFSPPYVASYSAPPGFPYAYSPPPPLQPPPKGAYATPPMFQPPYGAYPYPYPYPYPSQPFLPPPAQQFTPPTQNYPSQGDQSQSSNGQSYPQPMQPYPYAHPHPPAPPVPQQYASQQASHPEDPGTLFTTSSTRLPKSGGSTIDITNGSSSQSPDKTDDSVTKPRMFIVRTSEMYQSPPTQAIKPTSTVKRKREEDRGALMSSKRAEAETIGTYSTFRVSLSKTPAPTPTESRVESVDVPLGSRSTPVDGERDKCYCSNKTCKRLLPAGATGSLCERCRERLKRKQAKAKHRFKLEPKALLGRSAGETATMM